MDFELAPCLAWVRRAQKAAADCAQFSGHFTQIIRFPEVSYGNLSLAIFVLDDAK
jgi:hypothetical protein